MFRSGVLLDHELPKPKAAVFYHFLPPDEVVSSILYGELAAELVDKGWEVTAFACNRDCRDE
jgi:hypothetical protein